MSDNEFIEQYFKHVENGKRILEMCETLMIESLSSETNNELVTVAMDGLKGIANTVKYQEGKCFTLTINGIEISMTVRNKN